MGSCTMEVKSNYLEDSDPATQEEKSNLVQESHRARIVPNDKVIFHL